MSFKNTMRLFASNFALVWKQVLYFLVCFILIAVLSIKIAQPIINIFKENGIIDEIESLSSSLFSLSSKIYISFFDIVKDILNSIAVNFKEIYFNLILLLLFAFLLPYILYQMSIYNLSSIIYKKLSMNMNVGYTNNLIENFKSSLLYALTNILLSMPFWTIKILLLEFYFAISSNVLISYIGLFGLSAIYIILNSLKTALFTCYTGYSIENNKASIKVFSNSIALISGKNFWSILSSSVIICLISTVSNGFIGLFTFFAGLIVSIPAIFVLKSIFYIVVYFNKTGQRYYLGNNYIFNPVKYTVKQDENAVRYLTMEEPVEQQVIENITNLSNHDNKNK